jgi:Cof subfamily protein (haloacid dehalogenase superfamily)
VSDQPSYQCDLPYHLLAVDLDGTLLTSAKGISPRTAAVLRQVAERGAKVIIASARPPRSVRAFYEQLGLDTWQINYNGALVQHPHTRRILLHRPMVPQLVEDVVDFARRRDHQCVISLEVLDKWYTDRFDPSLQTETSRLFEPDAVGPLEEFLSEPVTKMLILGDEPHLSRLETELADEFATEISLTRSDQTAIQIMRAGMSKGVALAEVARDYGIARQRVVAIGDAPNDVGMLTFAAVGVAMANAYTSAKVAADRLTLSNDLDGVAVAVEELFLRRRNS